MRLAIAMKLDHTHSLPIGFIQRTLLLDLGQLHVDLLTNDSHRVSS